MGFTVLRRALAGCSSLYAYVEGWRKEERGWGREREDRRERPRKGLREKENWNET